MIDSWFVIVNPNAGNQRFKKLWNTILETLTNEKITFSFAFTNYTKHEIILVDEAIKQGYRNLISVGGDGTLHYVVNGIMMQRYVKTSDIRVAVIPIGTGNDWIKTYNIPNSIKKSIQIIKNSQSFLQDIGSINYNLNKQEYFLNVAGTGYSAYVVSKLKSLKKLGAISYLLSGLYGLFFYQKTTYNLQVNQSTLQERSLMILIGICRFSGGGMQMTSNPKTNDGLFDITIVKDFSFFDLILNLPKLYNGTIVNHYKVENIKAAKITIKDVSKNSFIESDGELISKGSFSAEIIPSAIQFMIPKN